MSRSFQKHQMTTESNVDAGTRDEDMAAETEAEAHLPPGSRAYMTLAGFRRFEGELRRLKLDQRPNVVETVSWAASNGDRSENGDYIYGKKRLREIDRRMRFLTKRLENAEVVDPERQVGIDKVYFGAWVCFENHRGEEQTVHIVGVDEARSELGEVSWVSPIARALHKAEEGDIVKLRTPDGVEEVEVIRIWYGGDLADDAS